MGCKEKEGRQYPTADIDAEKNRTRRRRRNKVSTRNDPSENLMEEDLVVPDQDVQFTYATVKQGQRHGKIAKQGYMVSTF